MEATSIFDNSIKEFRLCNPPPVLAAPLYASLQGYFEWKSFMTIPRNIGGFRPNISRFDPTSTVFFQWGLKIIITILIHLVFEETDIENLRAKGVQLSGFMIEMLKDTFEDKINIITPIEEESRGCQGTNFRSDKGNL